MEKNNIVYLKGNNLDGFYKRVSRLDCINCTLNLVGCKGRVRHDGYDYCKVNVAIKGRKGGFRWYFEKLEATSVWSGDCPTYVYTINGDGDVDAIDDPRTFVGIIVSYLPEIIEIDKPKEEKSNTPEEINTMDNPMKEITKEELLEKILSDLNKGFNIQVLNNDDVLYTIELNLSTGKYYLKNESNSL